jgi:magnesium and cobalt transporter
MGSSSDGSVVAPGVTADEGEEPPQRGFFGRILDAFSPPEPDAALEAETALTRNPHR